MGEHWNVQGDNVGFKITLKDRPSTRRGLLSNVSSIYDPLGLAAPFLFQGKIILQHINNKNIGWNETIPDDITEMWQKWKSSLIHLEEIEVPRCYKPSTFGKTTEVSLHHFSDANEDGYGQCSYIRLVDEFNVVHCSLVMGKCRVTIEGRL